MPIVATGGTSYEESRGGIPGTIYEFYTSGTFSVLSGSTSALCVEIIGPGGAGGRAGSNGGGGGSAGERKVVTGISVNATTGTYTITVGTGGPATTVTGAGANGSGPSSAFGHSAAEGVGGSQSANAGQNGYHGSGGGGGAGTTHPVGGTGSSGRHGGDGFASATSALRSGGGGAGQGASGANAGSATGGDGGDGISSDFVDTPMSCCAGGGGFGRDVRGDGGAHGGGHSAVGVNQNNATAGGTPGSGGGGAGGGGGSNGAAGADGMVRIWVPDEDDGDVVADSDPGELAIIGSEAPVTWTAHAAPGSLAISGQGGAFEITLVAASGAAQIVDSDAVIDVAVDAATGTLRITGSDSFADLSGETSVLNADPGTIVVTGRPAPVEIVLGASGSSLAVTGGIANPGVTLGAAPGQAEVQGALSHLTESPAAAPGALVVTGGTAAPGIEPTAATGRLAIAGRATTVHLFVDAGTLHVAVTGGESTAELDLTPVHIVAAESGRIRIAGRTCEVVLSGVAAARPDSWRSHIRRARAQVHATFQIDAVYVLRAGSPGRTVHVRLRHGFGEAGVDEGVTGLPRMREADPRVVFDLAEVPVPMPNSFVLVSESEAYRVGPADVPYTGYITAKVTRLRPTEAASLWATSLPPDFLGWS